MAVEEEEEEVWRRRGRAWLERERGEQGGSWQKRQQEA